MTITLNHINRLSFWGSLQSSNECSGCWIYILCVFWTFLISGNSVWDESVVRRVAGSRKCSAYATEQRHDVTFGHSLLIASFERPSTNSCGCSAWLWVELYLQLWTCGLQLLLWLFLKVYYELILLCFIINWVHYPKCFQHQIVFHQQWWLFNGVYTLTVVDTSLVYCTLAISLHKRITYFQISLGSVWSHFML